MKGEPPKARPGSIFHQTHRGEGPLRELAPRNADADKRAVNEPISPDAPLPIHGARIAAWLGGALLIGLLLLAILAGVDRARVASLEKFSETTAVGDRVYFALPSPLPKTPAAVARLHDAALMPVDYAKFGCRDSKMQAVARDPATKLTIYESRAPLPDADDGKLYFVKLAANEYLKLRAAKQ